MPIGTQTFSTLRPQCWLWEGAAVAVFKHYVLTDGSFGTETDTTMVCYFTGKALRHVRNLKGSRTSLAADSCHNVVLRTVRSTNATESCLLQQTDVTLHF